MDTTRLDAAQIARLTPQQVANAAAQFTREAVSGDYAAHVAREALLDSWREHRNLPTRAAAVADLIKIEVMAYLGRG